MRKHNQDIERIIRTGFGRLPVDDAALSQATSEILERGARMQQRSKQLFFMHSGPRRFYALAALFLLFCGLGSILLFRYFSRDDTKDMQCLKVQKDAPRTRMVSILSSVHGPQKGAAVFGRLNEKISTNDRSQMLLAVGLRTRTILFEQSKMQVNETDSVRTTVTLHNGTIAVDVAPGGVDIVSILTDYGSFTQIGTRFSVSVDSMRGAGLEVYSGKVRVRDDHGTDVFVAAGQAWESRSKDTFYAVHRSAMELEGMRQTFDKNKIENLLEWETSSTPRSATESKKPIIAARLQKERQFLPSRDTARAAVRIIIQFLNQDDFNAVNRIMTGLSDPWIADTLYKLIRSLAEEKTALFRLSKANRLLGLIVDNTLFTGHQREDASVRLYMLHKDNFKASTQELLAMIQRYRTQFPSGAFGDDIAIEAVSLLIGINNYHEAANEMKQLLNRYPRSPHQEYCRYLYASTLRENLQRTREALAEYEKYVAAYPNGKYEEDALYWTIQLSRSSNDFSKVARYKKAYLQHYPSGRWSEEIRAIHVSTRDE